MYSTPGTEIQPTAFCRGKQASLSWLLKNQIQSDNSLEIGGDTEGTSSRTSLATSSKRQYFHHRHTMGSSDDVVIMHNVLQLRTMLLKKRNKLPVRGSSR